MRMELAEGRVDRYGATVVACLTLFLDVPGQRAAALVDGWRNANPIGSAWSPFGEDHVEPLTIACELAFAGLTDAELLRREAEVWHAHRAEYHQMKAALLGNQTAPTMAIEATVLPDSGGSSEAAA